MNRFFKKDDYDNDSTPSKRTPIDLNPILVRDPETGHYVLINKTEKAQTGQQICKLKAKNTLSKREKVQDDIAKRPKISIKGKKETETEEVNTTNTMAQVHTVPKLIQRSKIDPDCSEIDPDWSENESTFRKSHRSSLSANFVPETPSRPSRRSKKVGTSPGTPSEVPPTPSSGSPSEVPATTSSGTSEVPATPSLGTPSVIPGTPSSEPVVRKITKVPETPPSTDPVYRKTGKIGKTGKTGKTGKENEVLEESDQDVSRFERMLGQLAQDLSDTILKKATKV